MLKHHTQIMKISVLLLAYTMLSFGVSAQKASRYMVYLTDKKESPYKITKPEAFLTKRAIERRARYNIDITERDLPVSPKYVEQIKKAGAKVWYTSRWLNAVVVEAEESVLDKVKSFDFVKPEVELLIKRKGKVGEVKPARRELAKRMTAESKIEKEEDYGKAINQIKMLEAEKMHQNGFKGKGMLIGVFDAGFVNVDTAACFAHLFEQGRVLNTYSFVNNCEYVYGEGSHGTQVLSTIAAYLPGEMIGTAPEASFVLFQTEDGATENRIEEANWLIAAERADSLGVDVINSSLGYTTFDEKSMNYSYDMLDGKTALITKAAINAARVGILVVTSAGNEGGSSWQYISAPADADSILTIGAVNAREDYASFSSTGPTADGRVKPDVCAKGLGATVSYPSGFIGISHGTSFSSPIMCGFVASFWQGNAELNNQEIIDIIRKSATQAENPDSLLGYGIPKYEAAQKLADELKAKKKRGMAEPTLQPQDKTRQKIGTDPRAAANPLREEE